MNTRERVENIQTVDDAENQLLLAKKYVTRMRILAKRQTTLSDKLAYEQKAKAAEKTLRDLRRLIFDIEDALAVGKPASSVLS